MISIDANKKELLGEFKNGGSDYSPQGRPIEVNTHDFEDKELGKVVPYRIYDIGANDGYVSLGIDHDTGQFAVNSVQLWLDDRRARYPGMKRLMITDVSINDSSFFDKESLRARTSRTCEGVQIFALRRSCWNLPELVPKHNGNGKTSKGHAGFS